MLDDTSTLAESGLLPIGHPERKLADYGRIIRAAVRGLWRGLFDRITFAENMIAAITYGLKMAFHEGAAEMGIKPEELTPEELIALDTHVNEQLQHVWAFALDIEAGSRANKGKLGPLMKRAELWQNKFVEVKNHAKVLTGLNRKLKWVLHGKRKTEQPCTDCLKLNGRIHRSSVWAAYDIRPQSERLKCGGWRCGCDFVVTADKGTSGRPPKLAGD